MDYRPRPNFSFMQAQLCSTTTALRKISGLECRSGVFRGLTSNTNQQTNHDTFLPQLTAHHPPQPPSKLAGNGCSYLRFTRHINTVHLLLLSSPNFVSSQSHSSSGRANKGKCWTGSGIICISEWIGVQGHWYIYSNAYDWSSKWINVYLPKFE